MILRTWRPAVFQQTGPLSCFDCGCQSIALRELVAAVQKELGWEVSDVTLSCAHRAMRRARRKTSVSVEQEREDVVEARRKWAAEQLTFDPDQGKFVDEVWTETNVTRTLGVRPSRPSSAGDHRPAAVRNSRANAV